MVQRYVAYGFVSVAERATLDVPELGRALLCHMPIRGDSHEEERYAEHRPTWGDVEEAGARWQIHGHVHEKWRVRDRMINVGVDVWDFRPVSAAQIALAANLGSARPQSAKGSLA